LTLNDNATLVVGTGKFYTATYNATTPEALPADLTAPGVNWVQMGHTSLSDVFSVSSDGGDATTIGTLQNKALRTTHAARTETFNLSLQQFDTDGLKLYYGSNATIGSAGEVQVPANPTPTVCSFLAVFIDGDNEFAIYAPKAEIFRADDLSIGDTESLASLPLAVKPLASGTNTWTYSITPIGDVTP
jgi:hypothetical protein